MPVISAAGMTDPACRMSLRHLARQGTFYLASKLRILSHLEGFDIVPKRSWSLHASGALSGSMITE
ncbi:hypothetical protein GCM10011491_08630 [Brucella endophytica]|uniref:Uncharacterized protein n=1 Tax=Brucella endophytica TaxID=1963359 RepID=A0A916WBJ8_9HYPH|nr:hypothetical protein GCM10011491_08630 [Brucella endophytica]